MNLKHALLGGIAAIIGLGLFTGSASADTLSCAIYKSPANKDPLAQIDAAIAGRLEDHASILDMIRTQSFYIGELGSEKLYTIEEYLAYVLGNILADPDNEDFDAQVIKLTQAVKLFLIHQNELRDRVIAIEAEIAALKKCRDEIKAEPKGPTRAEIDKALGYMALKTTVHPIETWHRNEFQTGTYETGDGTVSHTWEATKHPKCSMSYTHNLGGVPGTLSKGDTVKLTLTASGSGTCDSVGGGCNGVWIECDSGFDWADPENKSPREVWAGVPQRGKTAKPNKVCHRGSNTETVELEVVSAEKARLDFYIAREAGGKLVTTYEWEAVK